MFCFLFLVFVFVLQRKVMKLGVYGGGEFLGRIEEKERI